MLWATSISQPGFSCNARKWGEGPRRELPGEAPSLVRPRQLLEEKPCWLERPVPQCSLLPHFQPKPPILDCTITQVCKSQKLLFAHAHPRLCRHAARQGGVLLHGHKPWEGFACAPRWASTLKVAGSTTTSFWDVTESWGGWFQGAASSWRFVIKENSVFVVLNAAGRQIWLVRNIKQIPTRSSEEPRQINPQKTCFQNLLIFKQIPFLSLSLSLSPPFDSRFLQNWREAGAAYNSSC